MSPLGGSCRCAFAQTLENFFNTSWRVTFKELLEK